MMEKTNTSLISYGIMALVVVLACFALFSLDKGTHSVSDLFLPGNLVALCIYFIPAFVISVICHRYFSKKRGTFKGIAPSLMIGIPSGFILIICTFLVLK